MGAIENAFVAFENLFRVLGHHVTSAARDIGIPLSEIPAYEDLPDAPPEPPVVTAFTALMPAYQPDFATLEAELTMALSAVGFGLQRLETARTETRQEWLWGIGRLYKAPGRTGIVTDIRGATGAHPEGRAVDYGYPSLRGDASKADRDAALLAVAQANPQFRWGGTFHLTGGSSDPAHWEHRT
jgi:hypothetical protein